MPVLTQIPISSVVAILTISTICVFLIGYAQFRWRRRRMYELASKTTGPNGYPFIGVGHTLFRGPTVILDILSEIFENYPHFMRAWFGPQLIYGISKPEYLEQILKNHYDRGELFWKYNRPIFGFGLVTAPVDQWKKNRRVMNHAFNQKSLDSFVKSFAENANILTDKLKFYENKTDWDIRPTLVACMSDIISETIFGETINAQKSERLEFAEWIDALLTLYYTRICSFFYHFDFIFDKTNLAKKMKHYTSKLHDFTLKIVEKTRKEFENDTKDYEEKSIKERSKVKAPLRLLIELKEDGVQFTNEQLKNEMNSLAVAGMDTSASSLGFFFMALGIRQDVQKKIYEEIIKVIGDRQITFEDLPKLKYLDKAVKETLRLFPPVPISSRAFTEEIQLGEHTLAVGGLAVLCILETHRSPLYWKDPLVFDPERFSPEEIAKRHPFSYIPFGGGPRNCIGMKFATMAIKTIAATLVRKYKLKTPHKRIENIKLKSILFLRPSDGYKVIVEKRTN